MAFNTLFTQLRGKQAEIKAERPGSQRKHHFQPANRMMGVVRDARLKLSEYAAAEKQRTEQAVTAFRKSKRK